MLSKIPTQECPQHVALAIQTITDNLQSVESSAFLDIFSRPRRVYQRALYGHLSRQIHYHRVNKPYGVIWSVYENIKS